MQHRIKLLPLTLLIFILFSLYQASSKDRNAALKLCGALRQS